MSKSCVKCIEPKLEPNRKIILTCLEISDSLKDFYVRVSNWEIESVIANTSKDKAKVIYKRSLQSILRYSRKELVDLFSGNISKQYEDFCMDVALFYAMRYILLNKPIPIVKSLNTSNQVTPK